MPLGSHLQCTCTIMYIVQVQVAPLTCAQSRILGKSVGPAVRCAGQGVRIPSILARVRASAANKSSLGL